MAHAARRGDAAVGVAQGALVARVGCGGYAENCSEFLAAAVASGAAQVRKGGFGAHMGLCAVHAGS